jgi:hypothetical protein
MKQHDLHTSKDCTCEDESCFVCRYVINGGLAICKVCGGAEITLTTDCVGRKLDEAEEEKITAGLWDFKNGQWYSVPAVQAILNKSTEEKPMAQQSRSEIHAIIRDRNDFTKQMQLVIHLEDGVVGVAQNSGLELLIVSTSFSTDKQLTLVEVKEEVK